MRTIARSLLTGLLALSLPALAHAEVDVMTVSSVDSGVVEFCDGTICIQAYALSLSEQHDYCSDDQLVASLLNDQKDGDIGEKSRFSRNEDILDVQDLAIELEDSIGTDVHLGWFFCKTITPSVGSVTVMCVDPTPATGKPGPETYFTVCVRAIMDSTTTAQQ